MHGHGTIDRALTAILYGPDFSPRSRWLLYSIKPKAWYSLEDHFTHYPLRLAISTSYLVYHLQLTFLKLLIPPGYTPVRPPDRNRLF